MVLLGGTIALIIYIVIIVLVFKFLKSIVKTLLIASLLIIVIVGASSYFVYQDFSDLRENFGNSSKLVLLGDGNELLAGYSLTSLDVKNLDFLSLDKLENFKEDYQDEKYKGILGDNYKLFIFNLSIFNASLNNGVNINLMDEENPVILKGELLREALYSNNPSSIILEELADEMIKQNNSNLPDVEKVDEQFKKTMKEEFLNKLEKEFPFTNPGEFRAMVFSLLLKDEIMNQGVKEVFFDVRSESVVIYPQTAIFKLIKFAPSKIGDSMFSLIKINNDKDESKDK